MIDSSSHLSFGHDDTALSVLPLSHIFERQAMYMYLYEGMAVYYAESLDTIGPNLREVRPTILVGVPRIFEKNLCTHQERVTEKGKLNSHYFSGRWRWQGVRQVSGGKEKGTQGSGTEASHRNSARLFQVARCVRRPHTPFGFGSAALPEELGYIYLGAGIPIIQGYGLTETSPVITTGLLDDNRVGTVWQTDQPRRSAHRR
jgi:long-chain acyl-CoA synthetase